MTNSLSALQRALDLGVNFFDTADAYGDGHSEQLLAKLRKERSEPFHVATKAGRRLDPHVAAGYTKANLTAFVERSLKTWRQKRSISCNYTARQQKSFTCPKCSMRWTVW